MPSNFSPMIAVFLEQKRALQKTTAELENTLHSLDITAVQAVVICILADCPDCSQTDLVNNSGIDRSTMADIMPRLIERRLIERQRCQKDARINRVALTNAGTEIHKKILGLSAQELPA